MASNEQRWGPIFVGVNNQMVTYGAEYKEITLAPPEDMRQIKRWVRQIDRLVREPQAQTTDYNPSPPFFFHFNRKTYPDKKGDYPNNNDRERRPSPRPREDIRGY
jgi:hypothetical protein